MICATFQSLLHQGISLLGRPDVSRRAGDYRSFNPFFIRASVYCAINRFTKGDKLMPFQSLLHQGISLLPALAERLGADVAAVSIPSSSGHQFTGGGYLADAVHVGKRFNPFFIRASVYCAPGRPTAPSCSPPVSIPSSSGHQFTARSRRRALPSDTRRGFNPFFIRASVY